MSRRRRELDESSFTQQELRRGLWESSLLPFPKTLPPVAEEALVQLLNVLCNRNRDDQSFDKANALRRRIRQRFTKQLEDYTELRQEQVRYLQLADETLAANPSIPEDTACQMLQNIWTSSAQVLRERIDRIDQAYCQLLELGNDDVLEERSNGVQGWQHFAMIIYEAVREALGELAPRGASDSGPMGRFFSWLAPRLTGEDVTPGSAGRQLRTMIAEAREARNSVYHINSK
jgi:hypothetical protein